MASRGMCLTRKTVEAFLGLPPAAVTVRDKSRIYQVNGCGTAAGLIDNSASAPRTGYCRLDPVGQSRGRR